MVEHQFRLRWVGDRCPGRLKLDVRNFVYGWSKINTFDRQENFVAKVTVLFPASFYSNVNCPFSQPV